MTRTIRIRAIVAAAAASAAIACMPQLVSAQATCTYTNTTPCTLSPFNASLTPTDVMRLKLSSTSTNLGAPAKTDFTTGFIASTGPTLSVKANRAYRVTVQPTTAFFCVTSCPGVASTKPTYDLSWSANGTFTAFVFGTPQDVVASGLGTPSAGTGTPQATLSYKTALSYAVDKPGTYAVVVTITLTAP